MQIMGRADMYRIKVRIAEQTPVILYTAVTFGMAIIPCTTVIRSAKIFGKLLRPASFNITGRCDLIILYLRKHPSMYLCNAPASDYPYFHNDLRSALIVHSHKHISGKHPIGFPRLS